MNTPFLDFKPAEVKRNKEVYVAFYVLDPTNEKLKRIRIRCNRIKNRKEQERYASRICLEINRKLYEGWNPLTGENPAAKKKVSLTESAIRYVRAKEKVLRKDSARSYRTKLTFFVKWCEKRKLQIGYVDVFLRNMQQNFLMTMEVMSVAHIPTIVCCNS